MQAICIARPTCGVRHVAAGRPRPHRRILSIPRAIKVGSWRKGARRGGQTEGGSWRCFWRRADDCQAAPFLQEDEKQKVEALEESLKKSGLDKDKAKQVLAAWKAAAGGDGEEVTPEDLRRVRVPRRVAPNL